MKNIIIAVAALISLNTFACNPEAQFVGTVRNLKQHADHATFQVTLGHKGNYWFAPSGVCPLFEGDLEAGTVRIAGKVTIANGDEISGIMVQDEVTGALHIE